MPNFLSDLSIYNPKAAAAIADAVLECNNEKASMMSGLKTTANDVTLSDEIRLDAITALINLGNLLDIPLPPYFPSTVTYRNTQEFVGVHNDLEGLQGGAPGEYFHLTQAERDGVFNKASIADITWDNLSGSYSDNEPFALLFDNKQEQLVAPALGEFYVKINGTTIIYDNTPTIGNITGIVAGGELDGFYPNPTIQNVAVINKVLTGFNGAAATGTILATDSILTAFQKLNANINNVVNNPSGVSSVAFSTTATTVFTTSSTNTGAVTLSLGLISQNANLFLASPNGTAGQPSFRQLVNADLPNSGASAGVYGSASLIPRITVNAKGIITGIETVSNPSGGQVNSISITAPSFLSASSINSVIPATPIITLAFSGQPINQVFAGPASGATGTPLFRSLVVDDIPQLPITKIDGFNTDNLLGDGLGTSLIFMGNDSLKAVQTKVGGDLTALYDVINTDNTAVFTIKNQAVTYDKFQFIPNSAGATTRPILLGRFDAGQGIMQQMTLSDDFVINTTTGVIGLESPNPPSLVDVGDLLTSTGSNNLTRLSLPIPNDGYLLMPYAAASSPACGLIWGLVDGDITYTVDDTIPSAPYGNFSIGANKVTLDKIAQIANNTVLGNVSGGLADVAPLTATQLTTLVEQFNATNGGKVPATLGVGSTYFLNAGGGWSEVTGGGSPGGSNNQIQYKLGTSSFGGTADMEYISGTGVYVTADNFFISNSASARNFSINFDVSALGGDYQWSFPDAGDEFVGKDVSQTLTNKTLSTGSAINIGGGASTYDMWYSADSAGTITKIAGAVGNIGKYLKYTSTGPSWEGVSVTSTANIDGGVANQVLYQTGPGATGFIVAPTSADTFLKWTGTAFTWAGAGSGSGTVTSGAVNNLAYYSVSPTGTTVSSLGSLGTSVQVLHGNASGTPTWGAVALASDVSGTLPVGNGGTGATTLTGLLRGNGTTAITGSAVVGLTSEVTGTLPIGNGGTNTTTTPANGQLLIGNGTGYTVANLSQGGGINISNNAGAITISATGAAPALNQITDATATQARNHGNFPIDWGWNSLVSGTGFRISSTSTVSGGTTQKLFAVNSTGGNATAGVTTTAAEITNTHSGGTSTNIGLSLSASGGATINYALDITGGIARIAAGTASFPQLIITPSALSGGISPSINGSIWNDTNTTSGNSSLYLYKQFASASFVTTKIVTIDRNQDFAGGATSGIVVSDSNGNLTKSADLTALGIYAQTNDVTVVNTTTPTTIIGTTVGSATLPANFLGVGKTIIIFVSGTYSQASGSNTCTLNFSIGGVSIGSIALVHGNSLATTYFEARIVATCRTLGVSGTVQYQGVGLLGIAGNPDFYYITSATSGSINTTTTNAINVTATWSAANPSNSLVAGIHTAQYIN